MSSTNLTWDEAKARAALIEVDRYDIVLDLTDGTNQPGTETFGSKTTIAFRTREDAQDADLAAGTFVDIRARRITSVILNGEEITTDAIHFGNESYDASRGVSLRNLRRGENTVTVVADCEYSSTGEGLHRFQDPADKEVYLYTQFETADAKRVFACFDQPDLKATYRYQVFTPQHWKLITNSEPESSIVSRQIGNGTQRVKVALHRGTVDYKLSTYLVAFMAGPYTAVRDTWRGTITAHPETPGKAPEGEIEIPLGLYCRATLAQDMDSERLFRETKEGFDFYAKHFGVPYPFTKYDQVFCPEYNMGAMENAGAVTIREDYIFRSATTQYLYERRNDTILHEMAHMWFGDLVTMQWWNDLWLNESFATWSAAQAQVEVSDFTTAWVTFAHVEKAWAYSQDQLTSTHPITTDASDIETVDQNFDGITYAKGASVLKQLAAYVGMDAFFAGVRLHFNRHSFGNATFDDLLEALEESSGRDLSGWADMWLKTTGVNTLGVETETADGKYTAVTVTQTGAQPGAGELREHRIGVGVYRLIDGKVVRTAHSELDVAGERTAVPELVGAEAGDLILANDGDLTYALIELDPASQAFVLEHIAQIEDPMARALCWSAAWEQVRAAKMRARDFVALVGRGLSAESETAVVQQLVRQVVTAATHYADPEWLATEGWDKVAEVLVSAARKGEPGGDTQLAAVKELVRVRPSDDTVALARAILDKEPETAGFPGLAVDTDMQWLAIKLLASASAGAKENTVAVAGAESTSGMESLIAAAESHDRSSLGAQAAVTARALIPTAANKAQLWADISGEDAAHMSNRILLSKVAGFATPGRPDLLDGYTEKYLRQARSVWDNLGGEMALRVLSQMYPVWDTTDAALASAQAIIDDESQPAGFRRLIAEGHDNQKRCAEAQAFDRS